jgi:hypothetical protein
MFDPADAELNLSESRGPASPARPVGSVLKTTAKRRHDQTEICCPIVVFAVLLAFTVGRRCGFKKITAAIDEASKSCRVSADLDLKELGSKRSRVPPSEGRTAKLGYR